MSNRLGRRGRLALIVVACLAVAVLSLDRLFPVDLTRYQARSLALTGADGQLINVGLAADGMWRLGAKPQDVSLDYLRLLIATEDRRFWVHPGIDPLALGRAAFQLVSRGHVVSGGSTLTMQVARLLHPHPHNWVGKLRDIARALQLEAHFSKRDILSMYLTLAPFGGNIEGVRAASLIYFEREPASLTLEQAALLVALPRSPTRLRPDRHAARAVEAAKAVLARNDVPLTGVWPAPISRHRLPDAAPHLAARLRLAGRSDDVRTTLDASLQAAVEQLSASERLGKTNAAILVIRNRDRAVLAYLGGTDYFAPSGGMVDMVRARRSPGSTLKPLIYAAAFDAALVQPDTLIEDTAMQLGGYAPRNIDRSFHGRVTVREALQQSYNLPAIALLQGIGPRHFMMMLQQAGAKPVLPQGAEPALPIALGGVGISLEDLGLLFTGLADGGRFGRLHLLAGEAMPPSWVLLTDKAARQTADILRGAPMPPGIAADAMRPVAYKTGTSYEFRDAWSVGFSGRYTVAVWVGRTDGSPHPGAFGRSAAAPLLFACFSLLPLEPMALPGSDEPSQSGPVASSLRRFTASAGPDIERPRILFPPAGSRLEMANAKGNFGSLALEAGGGQPPYRWAVNDMPLARPPTGIAAAWKPDGYGFFRLSVIDRNGHTASEQIRIQ